MNILPFGNLHSKLLVFFGKFNLALNRLSRHHFVLDVGTKSGVRDIFKIQFQIPLKHHQLVENVVPGDAGEQVQFPAA